MIVAVLSGKGGTGKTLVSVNLASVVEGDSIYVDCDVEEPNGHLYFRAEESDKNIETISRLYPVVDSSKCLLSQNKDACAKCVDFCRFNALARVGERIQVFDQVCHSCGGCAVVCPAQAITEEARHIGHVYDYKVGNTRVLSGQMQTKQAFGIPIIAKILELAKKGKLTTIIDCPPGSACTVMESIKDADFCIVVAEPSVFGAHNMKMVVQLLRLFEKPFAAILNKYVEGAENPSETLCEEENIEVLHRIPFDVQIAHYHSEARIAAEEEDRFKEMFESILKRLTRRFGGDME